MQETQVGSLGWKGPLEKAMATHSDILAWRIPWTEGPGGLQSMRSQRVRHDWATNFSGSMWLYLQKLPYINMNLTQVYTCSPSRTPLPPPSPSHPSGSSQCTSPEHPVSCIKPGLAICFTYDNTHVSMLFSQIIPSLPSPTESKNPFFTSVSLLLSCIIGSSLPSF